MSFGVSPVNYSDSDSEDRAVDQHFNYEQVGRVGRHLKCFVFMCKIHYNHQSAAILTFSRSVVVFPSKIPAPNAFSRLKLSKITLQIYVKYYVLLLYDTVNREIFART